ncbi:MAG: hypothetical protein QGI31_02425 [Dehalococcoidia bacterium]|nr:hypothetical protein [Dehalococcoidia bacterium]
MPENIHINNHHAQVTISPEAGASLRSIKVKKRDRHYELLSGGANKHNPTRLPPGEGSFVMAPWVNRIRDGKLVTPNGVHQIPLNAPPHAIHGLVRESKWQIDSVNDLSIEMSINLSKPWPFNGHIKYSIALQGRSLVQTMQMFAADDESRAFPGSLGWHPWFNRSLGSDTMEVKAEVSDQWELDQTLTATGNLVDSTFTNQLKNGVRLMPGDIDDCFLRVPNGKVTLTWPELKLEILGSEAITHFMLYSPEHAICVEPQTSTVDAARLAENGIARTGHVLVDREHPLIATTTWTWDE